MPPVRFMTLNFADNKNFVVRGVSTRNRSTRHSLLLVSGPTRKRISIEAHQLVRRILWCERRSNTTPRARELHIDEGHISPAFQEKKMRSMAGFPINDRVFYLARSALDPPTSLCKKFPAIDEWHDRLAAKNSVLATTILSNQPSLPMHLYRWSWCSGRLIYQTRFWWWNSTPAISFVDIQSSLIQPTFHSKGKSAS
jgi:hypothetical protein